MEKHVQEIEDQLKHSEAENIELKKIIETLEKKVLVLEERCSIFQEESHSKDKMMSLK